MVSQLLVGSFKICALARIFIYKQSKEVVKGDVRVMKRSAEREKVKVGVEWINHYIACLNNQSHKEDGDDSIKPCHFTWQLR